MNQIQELNLLVQFGETYKERVERAIQLLTMGQGIVLVDDESRENEGDLIFAAESISVAQMATMIRECSGIVCVCIEQTLADHLNLVPMVEHNTSRFQTAFTVSVEARSGVTTGVSAKDRVQTIRTLCAKGAKPEHLARPGHVFPLRAAKGGVLSREGHTEGSVDLMKLSGLAPQAVLCELTNEDGTMARLPEICSFVLKRGWSVLSVKDIIEYRTFVRDCYE
jgi:3,4-dihydroxy 2-butanone 4-phosphate synthase